MLANIVNENIQFVDSVVDWKEAIRISAAPLLEKKFIQESYIEGMIESVKQNGTYIILLPGIAMPHTTSNGNVAQTSMSFTKFQTPVEFDDGNKADIFFCLAAIGGEEHMELISDLAMLLMEEENVEALKNVQDSEQLLGILK